MVEDVGDGDPVDLDWELVNEQPYVIRDGGNFATHGRWPWKGLDSFLHQLYFSLSQKLLPDELRGKLIEFEGCG